MSRDQPEPTAPGQGKGKVWKTCQLQTLGTPVPGLAVMGWEWPRGASLRPQICMHLPPPLTLSRRTSSEAGLNPQAL